jgi:hypothetical protein
MPIAEIQRVAAADTYCLRARVLRDGDPAALRVPDDDLPGAWHLGPDTPARSWVSPASTRARVRWQPTLPPCNSALWRSTGSAGHADDKLAYVEQIKKFTIAEGDWPPGGDELTLRR